MIYIRYEYCEVKPDNGKIAMASRWGHRNHGMQTMDYMPDTKIKHVLR